MLGLVMGESVCVCWRWGVIVVVREADIKVSQQRRVWGGQHCSSAALGGACPCRVFACHPCLLPDSRQLGAAPALDRAG